MSRKLNVYGIGNGIMDILLTVPFERFELLGLKKGGYAMVDSATQKALLDKLSGLEPALASGGSVANSAIAVAQLGGKAGFSCCLGDDHFGTFYRTEFRDLGIDLRIPAIPNETTGVCISLITPDADRTLSTSLGVATQLSANHIIEDQVRDSEWIYIEGYVFAQPEFGHAAVSRAIELAKKHDTKIAITFSDAFIIEHFGAALREAVKSADLIFANEKEASAYTGRDDAEDAFSELQKLVPNVVVTRGERGVLLKYGRLTTSVPAFECDPVDLTGAGDMLSGAFLYGITHAVPADLSARAACYLASKVICRVGARLRVGVPEFWREALAS